MIKQFYVTTTNNDGLDKALNKLESKEDVTAFSVSQHYVDSGSSMSVNDKITWLVLARSTDDLDDVEPGDSKYLRDLAERLMHVPVAYGVDQGDTDRLCRIAKRKS